MADEHAGRRGPCARCGSAGRERRRIRPMPSTPQVCWKTWRADEVVATGCGRSSERPPSELDVDRCTGLVRSAPCTRHPRQGGGCGWALIRWPGRGFGINWEEGPRGAAGRGRDRRWLSAASSRRDCPATNCMAIERRADHAGPVGRLRMTGCACWRPGRWWNSWSRAAGPDPDACPLTLGEARPEQATRSAADTGQHLATGTVQRHAAAGWARP